MIERAYVSDTITNNIIKTLDRGINYLIGSEMGSGKNYWVRNVLLPFASNANKRTLILSHRSITRDQQNTHLYYYEQQQLRQFRGGMFLNITYQELENKIIRNDFDLNYYDFIVCDECHYFTKDSNMNPRVETSFDWLNKNTNAVKFFLTGTYKSFMYLPWDNLTQLKEADYFNNNCEEIYGYKNIEKIKPIIEEQVINGKKVMMLFSKINEGKQFINSTLNNSNLLISNNSSDNDDYSNIVKNQSFNTDILVTTSLMCEGVEIKDTPVETVVIDDILDFELMAQTLARVRDRKVKLYYKKPSHQKIINRYVKYRNLLESIEEFESIGAIEFVKKYGDESIKKSHSFLNVINVIDPVSRQEYNQLKLHKCNVASIQYQHDMYLKMLDNGFEKCLEEYFPSTPIYDYDMLLSQELIESKILEDFIEKRLFKDDQQRLKSLLVREYGFKKSSLSSINKEFESKNIAYILKSKKERSRNDENYNKNYWLLENK
ncbi:DEAD/DEAH box helicase family protein [Clostridium botulinum]|uniref:DEAD/DEAH box helicase family protein n=1 Tax=Clostridium botulinum TaxID=1491 RepID=UPI002247D845|nr:DEAD/DEAH box helicase family protein [Clostridium botulinum]UZP04420.1 DEAD/DEAH box helicase family protein [Clostridium botulinum]UZP07832.1 DEAD/DEAH box helicase family protein [Clostridium botulinum]UZP11159.1 DEAD/DEAH box helicase family protein [Clostridium botulinum]